MTRLTDKQIKEHPLLTEGQRILCQGMRDRSRIGLELQDFALYALRGTAQDFTETWQVTEVDDPEAVRVDRDLRQAAVLYVYEALKSSDNDLIKAWPHRDDMLRNLVILAGEL